MSEAVASASERRLVTKLELCEAIGWSRMKLDRRLDEDAEFPVEVRGAQGAPWSFDLDAVQAYLAPELEEIADEAGPAEIAAGRPEQLTPRQRRDLAQALIHEDKLRKSRGDLVEAGPLKLALTETVTRVNTALNKMPETLTRRLNLPASADPILRQEIDEIRRQLVLGLREMLG